nr:glycosyltransferase family 4 protein [Pelagibacteraceae bacterium]
MAKRVNKKRILIYSLVFSPDGVSTAHLYSDLVLGFKKKGYQVTVLTSTPHYNITNESLIEQPLKKKFFGLLYTSIFNGVKVYHVPLKKYKNHLIRILSFIYWHISSFIVGLFLKKPNIILTPSPPLTNGVFAILLGKIKGSKSIYNVQEIYPDLLINLGYIRNGVFIKILKKIERWVYNMSDVVTTIDNQFYNIIEYRIKEKNKLTIIPNFVDTELYSTKSSVSLPDEFKKKEDYTDILYAGNIGLAQEWDLIINLAKEIREFKINIWIVGEGLRKVYLESEIEKYRLNNIKLLPYYDRKYMPGINLFADIHFIAMNKKVEKYGFPSKVYTIMASGKPILVVSSEETPIVSFLKDKNAALLVTDHSISKFKEELLKLHNSKDLRDKLGANGRQEIKKKYSKQVVIEQYLRLFNELC